MRDDDTIMPNKPADLAVVTELLDRISVIDGGSAEISGAWALDRGTLITEVAAQIVTFQRANARPIDGVIQPADTTWVAMQRLASDNPAFRAPIKATVVPAPNGSLEHVGAHGVCVADPMSFGGTKPLKKSVATAQYVRKLVRVDGCSIKWFGVVIPQAADLSLFGRTPHLHFTPTADQAGCSDDSYDSFSGWERMWLDYTESIGGQLAAALVGQILVLPFYRADQQGALGNFLDLWKDATAAAIKAAAHSIDPMYLGDRYEFSRIVSSSFCNGYVAHRHFHSEAPGASAMTDALFDLDGQHDDVTWRPEKGVLYLNRAPEDPDALGHINQWHVGDRWSGEFEALYGGAPNTHACCRNHLLYHGLRTYCA